LQIDKAKVDLTNLRLDVQCAPQTPATRNSSGVSIFKTPKNAPNTNRFYRRESSAKLHKNP